MKKLIFIFTILSCFTAYAQDYKADIEKACRIFWEDSFEMEMEHHLYQSPEAKEPAEKETIWMCKSGDSYRTKYYGTEVICNPPYMIMIDDNWKIVSIEKQQAPVAPTEEDLKNKEIYMDAMKEMLSKLGVDSVKASSKETFAGEYLGQKNGSKIYRFNYLYGTYEQVTIYISLKTGLIQKMACITREPMEVQPGVHSKVKIDMIFRKLENGKKYDKKLFSFDDVLSINNNGEITLKEKYVDYHLINRTLNK